MENCPKDLQSTLSGCLEIHLCPIGHRPFGAAAQKGFMDTIRNLSKLKPTDEYIDDIYDEAKERQRIIERVGRDISIRMHNLHDPDIWKRWGTYHRIDETVARANEKINKWKEAAWPKVRFIDDESIEETSSSSSESDDDVDETLGAAAPR